MLTPKAVQDISKEYLYHYDNDYITFKTLHGTAMYYQDVKKKLMATLRQKGAPTFLQLYPAQNLIGTNLFKQYTKLLTQKKLILRQLNRKIQYGKISWLVPML